MLLGGSGGVEVDGLAGPAELDGLLAYALGGGIDAVRTVVPAASAGRERVLVICDCDSVRNRYERKRRTLGDSLCQHIVPWEYRTIDGSWRADRNGDAWDLSYAGCFVTVVATIANARALIDDPSLLRRWCAPSNLPAPYRLQGGPR